MDRKQLLERGLGGGQEWKTQQRERRDRRKWRKDRRKWRKGRKRRTMEKREIGKRKTKREAENMKEYTVR